MSRLFYHVMQDNLGNLLFDVTGTMRLAGTGTVATIYGDEALTVPIGNPMTNHPSFGSFKCFLGPGDYDFYLAKSGYTFETLTGVQGAGTMADQNANGVGITGGTVVGLTSLSTAPGSTTVLGGTAQLSGPVGLSVAPDALYALKVGGASSWFQQTVGVMHVPALDVSLILDYTKAGRTGIALHAADSDGAGNAAILFTNLAGAGVGSISCTGTTTTYGTTSDARLKHAIAPLTGALDVVRQLNPVSFLWKSDGSPGRGFLAQEVQEVIPDGVITGERDAVDNEGNVVPQQIDYSKLVPWLVSAVKELTQQVEMLQAQLEAAGV